MPQAMGCSLRIRLAHACKTSGNLKKKVVSFLRRHPSDKNPRIHRGLFRIVRCTQGEGKGLEGENWALVEKNVSHPLDQHDGVQMRNPLSLPCRFFASGVNCLVVALFLMFMGNVALKMVQRSVPVMETFLARSLGSAVLICGGQCMSKRISIGSPKNFKWLFLRGFIGTFATMGLFGAIHLLPLADALTIFYANIAMTALLASFLRLDSFRFTTFAGVGMCLIGMLLVMHPTFLFSGVGEWSFSRSMGLLFALAAMFLSSGSFLVMRRIGRSEDASIVTLWLYMVGIPFATLMLVLGYPQKPVWMRFEELKWMGINIVCSLAANVLNTRGVQLSGATVAATVGSLQLVLAQVVGVLFIGDALSWLSVMGSTCMIIGGYLVTRDT